jgi:type II secretion system protein H
MLSRRRQRRRHSQQRGFTLVELILALAVMATIMALAAPTLGRSMRDKHLKQEGLRILAATELARGEAIATGVPMTLWFDQAGGTFGVMPKAGFDAPDRATRDFALPEELWIDSITSARGRSANETTVEFAPDGVPEVSGVDTITLSDKFGGKTTIARTDDGWGFEILEVTR